MTVRRRLPVSALVAMTAGCATGAETQTPTVTVDGLFGEWSDASAIIDDAADAPEAAVDILSLQGLDDASWLYLALDVGNEVSLQGLPGTLRLLLDTDADSRTGGARFGMDGVDLVVELSQLRDTPFEGYGFGTRLYATSSEGARPVEHSDLGMVSAPTWSAPRFELRLSRRGSATSTPFGARIRLKAVYVERGRVVDETETGSYAFSTPASPPPPPAGSPPTKPEDAVRIAQWNVSNRSFQRQRPLFAHVLAALRPDIVLLDEVPGTLGPEDLTAFFASGPLGALGSWTVVHGEAGGNQHATVAARDLSTRAAESFRAPRYPPGRLDELAAIPVDGLRPGRFETILSAEEERGLSAAGAWIEIDDEEVLFVALDLFAGGWAGSPQDLIRTVQANVVRDLVARELDGTPAPIVVGGDLNLVGSRAPLFALTGGLDVDGSDLTPLEAERLGERTLSTWRIPLNPFTPGRLDFMLLPDAHVEVRNAFVFGTEDLDEATLTELGLESGLSLTLSDHLVLVADLRFGAPTTDPR